MINKLSFTLLFLALNLFCVSVNGQTVIEADTSTVNNPPSQTGGSSGKPSR
ncbi:hypothetical protein [Geminocystis sp. NIES-3709]|uniref:hypothetical protein n=1 Tax=Geminocystis sp. NIES-3709 TaxID=1617448 RepID=UPI0005FCAB86|nr:hypothetical protein [Geminocystis sp. NIES-3709]BAQ63938.1 hypothetical protein GM3709_703 [Geminocystis sp. NIES-3709]